MSDEEELDVHVILGLEDLCKLRTGKMVWGKPVAEQTKSGWTLLGPVELVQNNTQIKNLVMLTGEKLFPADQLEKLWDLDTVGIREGDKVHTDFKDSSKFNGSRYIVELLWKPGNYVLPSNRELCECRLISQIKRLKKDPDQLKAYDDVIKEQLETGIVEPVPDEATDKRIHYNPHHGVWKRDAETTKLRLVYDASAKERKRDRSLNECLHKGPPLTPLLFDVLMRFRMLPIALVGDVQKAFHQVEVCERDLDCLRFLWMEYPTDIQLKIQEFRFTRVIIGSGPSPFLLNGTFQKHFEKYQEVDPLFVKQALDNLYVDDYLGGADTPSSTLELWGKLKEQMKEGGFQMHKWKTNSEKVLRSLKSENNENGDETFAK